MRIFDSQVEHKGDGWSVEIAQYHDERHGTILPTRWHARIVIVDDTGVDVVSLNRATQMDLFKALENISTAFEIALTAVMDTAAV